MFDTTEKKERSLGTKLFLKPERCASPKCVTVRRPIKPGVHGKKRRRGLSEYGEQLREKQKMRYSYGLREAQFRRLFEMAAKHTGVTGELLAILLERRLDNAVYRSNFAPSRSVARQLVGHGHIIVNSRKVTIPSYSVRVGDVIAIRPASQNHPAFKDLGEALKKKDAPSWLSVDPEKLQVKVTAQPKDFEVAFDINLVVDYYSKLVK